MTASSDARWRQPATRRSLRVGDVTVCYEPDGYVELEPSLWYQTRDLGIDFPMTHAGFLVASVGAVVVQEPDGVVLVDVGLGPVHVRREQTHPSLGTMTGGLLAATLTSLPAADITIATTHPHEDHVGWLCAPGSALGGLLRKRPVLAGKADVSRLRQMTGLDSVTGLTGGEQVSASVSAVSTPGHTPGHLAYVVESRGQRAVILGDTFHSAAQLLDPTLTPWSDEIPEQARRSRQVVLELLDQPQTVGVGYHFADVVFGSTSNGTWSPVREGAGTR